MPDAYETLIYEQQGPTAVITMNRPAVMNALNARAIAEIGMAFAHVRDDADVRGAILTGAGERAFVAGADIAELARLNAVGAARVTREGQAVFDLIENLGKPVIAAINGVALGGGCELAMACTFRIAAESARFGQPEVRLGLIPGYGGTQRLPRLVGKGRALQLILTGDMIGADEALRIGLVNEVMAPAALLPRAHEILGRIYGNGPLATAMAIEAVNRGMEGTVAEGLALESALFAVLSSTEDKAEGAAAFLEKRSPRFTGA